MTNPLATPATPELIIEVYASAQTAWEYNLAIPDEDNPDEILAGGVEVQVNPYAIGALLLKHGLRLGDPADGQNRRIDLLLVPDPTDDRQYLGADPVYGRESATMLAAASVPLNQLPLGNVPRGAVRVPDYPLPIRVGLKAEEAGEAKEPSADIASDDLPLPSPHSSQLTEELIAGIQTLRSQLLRREGASWLKSSATGAAVLALANGVSFLLKETIRVPGWLEPTSLPGLITCAGVGSVALGSAAHGGYLQYRARHNVAFNRTDTKDIPLHLGQSNPPL
jgi:hypothetical protein